MIRIQCPLQGEGRMSSTGMFVGTHGSPAGSPALGGGETFLEVGLACKLSLRLRFKDEVALWFMIKM